MSLTSGTWIGPYEIRSPLGAGGMGEVYRARDPKLSRDVAIKVLPAEFARDTDRMARFEREAKVLASLSHPNIATIFGIEDSDSTRALVMELVEGPTLAERIRQGSIPADEAVLIARQIADALEYAHERGIVHRDLKPANVKVKSDDMVKVLDFSLAKALESDASSVDISTSPTISQPATQAGILLGTAAYMSPEQAKAKPVDRRADIWAFGCVLYEMLTGKRAFEGETVTDTLAAVIKEVPDWSRLPTTTPVRVRVLLLRCLQKDPKQRLRDIGDARISLDEILVGVPEPTHAVSAQATTPWRRALPWALFAAAVVALAAVAWAYLGVASNSVRPTSVQRFELTGPEQNPSLAQSFQGRVASLSPDGTTLLFFGSGTGGVTQLWIRRMDSLEAHPLVGTEGAAGFPFWSSASRYVAFGTENKLKKVDIASGSVENLCDSGPVLGGFWAPDGAVIFSQLSATGPGLFEVPASGGSAIPFLDVPPPARNGGSLSPLLLPDRKHFLYIRNDRPGLGPGGAEIYLASLSASASQQGAGKLLTRFSWSSAGPPAIVFASSSDSPSLGYLLLTRWDASSPGALLAQTLDLRKLELTGEPVLLAEGVSYGGFSTSLTGALVYGSGNFTRTEQLTLLDRQGQILGTAAGSNDFVVFSPDGKRMAATRFLPQSSNLWLTDLERGVTSRFTFDSGDDLAPVWSPDGSHIVFASSQDGSYQLYEKLSNGGGQDELLFRSDSGAPIPTSWSQDGRYLLFGQRSSEGSNVFVLPLDGNGRPAGKPFLFTQGGVGISARFSPGPGGRPLWIAYASRESGRSEVYVRPFDPDSPNGTPPEAGKWQVSTQGGSSPRWNGNGKELLYLAPDGTVMSVEVGGTTVFQYAAPKSVFKPKGLVQRGDSFYWDASADGKKFIFPISSTPASGAAEPSRFTVVLNWPSLLKK